MKCRTDFRDVLAAGVVEPFGDSKDACETTRDAAIAVTERGVGRMMGGGLGFSVVIADKRSDEGAIAVGKARDVAVERQIFAVFVVATVADGVADVMEERSRFEKRTRLRRKMVNRLELVEKLESKVTYMFGVLLVLLEAAGEAADADQHLASGLIVAMRLLAGESVASNFVDDAFADADGGNGHGVNVEVAAKGDEDNGGDAHHVRAVAANAVGFHAVGNVATQEIGQAFAQERELDGGKTVHARAGSDESECFGVATKRDRKFIAEIGPGGKFGFQQGANVTADLFGLDRANHAVNIQRAHQADRADRKLSRLIYGVIAKKAEFEAATAEVDDGADLGLRAKRGEDAFATKA